jgi:chromosome partitioning protein
LREFYTLSKGSIFCGQAQNKRRAYDQVELISLREKWGDAVLDVELQERAATKLAKEHPVWKNPRGDSDRRAAAEMRSVCDTLFKRIGL